MRILKTYLGIAIASLATTVYAQSFSSGLVVCLGLDGNLDAQYSTTNAGSVFAGTPRYTTGILGLAARFNNDGSSSSTPSDWAVSLGDLEQIYSNSFSVSLWVRMFNNDDDAVLGNKNWSDDDNFGWALTTHNGQNVNWNTVAGSKQNVDLHPPVLDGNWHLVTMVFDRDANRGYVYLDGSPDSDKKLSNDSDSPLTPTPSFNTLLGASGPGRHAGRADIDDLGIWNRALTADGSQRYLPLWFERDQPGAQPADSAGDHLGPHQPFD